MGGQKGVKGTMPPANAPLLQPTDVAGLDALRSFLGTMGGAVGALEAVTADTQARLDRLAEFGYATPPHVLQATWTARLWPARVEAARLGAAAFLSNLNDRLIAALRDEKAAFARELSGYPQVGRDGLSLPHWRAFMTLAHLPPPRRS